eukprot:120475_1
MATVQANSLNFHNPASSQTIPTKSPYLHTITNNPKYNIPCRYNPTRTGCRYGNKCYYQHFNLQTPIQQKQYKPNIMTNTIQNNPTKIKDILSELMASLSVILTEASKIIYKNINKIMETIYISLTNENNKNKTNKNGKNGNPHNNNNYHKNK